MQSKTEISLTSAEISVLWRIYMNDSMAVRILKYFLEKVKDTDIRPIVEFAFNLAQQHIQTITDIYHKEGYPVPQGFTDEDMDITAPPLFNDNFYLFYLHYMSRVGLNNYSIALPQMVRQDVLDFLTNCLNQTTELARKVIMTKLSAGLLIRPPKIIIPDQIDFIKKQSFLAGFWGEKRSMIAGEIAQIFLNIHSITIIKALLTGFAQVSESEKVKDFMKRGKNIAAKHIEILSTKLKEEDVPAPGTWESFVTDSIENTFSDKMMMFHVSMIVSSTLSSYGNLLAISMRHDLQADFIRLSAEIVQYGAGAINIMVDHGWMEQPPQAINHDALVRV